MAPAVTSVARGAPTPPFQPATTTGRGGARPATTPPPSPRGREVTWELQRLLDASVGWAEVGLWWMSSSYVVSLPRRNRPSLLPVTASKANGMTAAAPHPARGGGECVRARESVGTRAGWRDEGLAGDVDCARPKGYRGGRGLLSLT
jgi:hypothetical protein